MKIKAIKSFAGKITMIPDEERNVRDELAKDLIRAGYAEQIGSGTEPATEPPTEPPAKPKGAKKTDK